MRRQGWRALRALQHSHVLAEPVQGGCDEVPFGNATTVRGLRRGRGVAGGKTLSFDVDLSHSGCRNAAVYLVSARERRMRRRATDAHHPLVVTLTFPRYGARDYRCQCRRATRLRVPRLLLRRQRRLRCQVRWGQISSSHDLSVTYDP